MEFKCCPNCRGVTFYVEPEPDKLVFFRVAGTGDPVETTPPHAPLAVPDLSLIHCGSCSWSGPPSGLRDKEN